MWFDQLTGFTETPANVRRLLQLRDGTLYSHANGRQMQCGQFEAVSLAQLRQRASKLATTSNSLTLREWVGDVQQLHADNRSAGALFQVASQFNALEMPSPDISPDHGISDYQYDRTQGPACAIACGAGTLYRQYFLPFAAQLCPTNTPVVSPAESLDSDKQLADNQLGDKQLGQTRHRQLDMAAPLHQALQQALGCGSLWRMQNGYLLADEPALRAINHYLQHASEQCKTELRNLLQIGMQWHTEVTLKAQTVPGYIKGVSGHAGQNLVQHTEQNAAQNFDLHVDPHLGQNSGQNLGQNKAADTAQNTLPITAPSQVQNPAQTTTQALGQAPAQTKTQTRAGHLVSQAYCSALPVAYNDHSADLWQPFAQLVLDAAYEATLAAAVINAQQTGNNTVFLTQLGGGAFGNRSDWIFNAIDRALHLYQHFDLDVVMVSYGRASGEVARLIHKIGGY